MKITKAIFGVDDSYFLEFWPIQAKICKELLGIEPVLFYICDEDSDFYHDGNGMVKKFKKVRNNQNGNIVNTGLLACIVRMYGTKYFPDEVCLTCDLDMLMINKDYFVNQIEKYNDNSLVIYSSDAYDLNRPESVELFNNQPFPFTQEMYNYPYNAAKGKVFNQILNTDCTFEEFVNRHANYKPGYNFMWMIDEFYFADCVNNKNHNVEVHKLKRGYTSPWIADRRIDRGNFPVQLEWEGEIEFQNKYGVYDEQKLRDGYYIDANCCRPYSKYKDEIDKLVNIVLKNDFIEVIEIDETTELCEIMERHGSDKSCKPTWVDYEGHNYTRFYSQLFNDIRTDNINFFELGLGTNNTDIPCNMGRLGTPGASIRAWKEYFPNANLYGADIDKTILFNEDRVKTFYCDQTNSIEIQKMWKNIDNNFDIIIDDGLHEFNANLNFLKSSLNKLNDDGYYIIEDVVNGELDFWKKEIKKLREEFPAFEFKIVKLKWTHDDNNLIVIKKENNTKINNFDWGWMENLEVTNLKSLLVKEVFEDRIYERFFSVEEGDIVLDIGSSVGPFAYSILNKKPKHVYCLEPSSIEFSTLNKNLRGYPVTPINKGIGEHNNGFYSDVVFGEFGNEKTFIESINFSTLLKNYNLDKIDFFKIDCEGGEYHVFTPEHLEFLKTIPKITGEWHLQTEEEKSLFRNFRDNILPNFNNYEVYSVDDVNVKWDLWNEHFIEYYRQVIIHIDNR